MVSRMSISPQFGQGAVSWLSPRSQKAGQMPLPVGTWMRASKRPYFCAKRFWVLRRGEGDGGGGFSGSGHLFFFWGVLVRVELCCWLLWCGGGGRRLFF